MHSITNYSYSTNGSTYTALSPAQTSSPLTINAGFTVGSSYNIYIKLSNIVRYNKKHQVIIGQNKNYIKQ